MLKYVYHDNLILKSSRDQSSPYIYRFIFFIEINGGVDKYVFWFWKILQRIKSWLTGSIKQPLHHFNTFILSIPFWYPTFLKIMYSPYTRRITLISPSEDNSKQVFCNVRIVFAVVWDVLCFKTKVSAFCNLIILVQ